MPFMYLRKLYGFIFCERFHFHARHQKSLMISELKTLITNEQWSFLLYQKVMLSYISNISLHSFKCREMLYIMEQSHKFFQYSDEVNFSSIMVFVVNDKKFIFFLFMNSIIAKCISFHTRGNQIIYSHFSLRNPLLMHSTFSSYKFTILLCNYQMNVYIL